VTTVRKALFIIHDVGNYGASRSLQLLLRNLKDCSVDIIVKQNLLNNLDDSVVREKFGKNVRNIFRTFLPYDLCFKGKSNSLLINLRALCYQYLFRLFGKRKINAILESAHYDFIHINSLILHPLIDEKYPFIIHVRELVDTDSYDSVATSLKKAQGVLFIDESTQAPFNMLEVGHNTILNNPFDMLSVSEYGDWVDRERARLKAGLVFAIIGGVKEDKGVHVAIEAFRGLENRAARLLVVGRGDRGYEKRCKTLAGNDERIIFWGEEPEINKIYALCDVVIRGEDRQCVGRTVYEALYAGCGVIVPGFTSRVSEFFEYGRFREKFLLYEPRNVSALQQSMKMAQPIPWSRRQFLSNVDEYVDKFKEFVESLKN
jgi:glycosyltransferase involved in cell wall biosynthesis